MTAGEMRAVLERLAGPCWITRRVIPSASTVQNVLDPLRVIFRRAIRRDVVSVDPTEHLELRRPDGRRDRIAAPREAVGLLAVLPDFERALWATALYAGLRPASCARCAGQTSTSPIA